MDDQVKQRLAKTMRGLRVHRGLSQGEVALRMATHRTRIADFERAKAWPKMDALVRFGEIVGVPAWQILAQAQGFDFKTMKHTNPEPQQERLLIRLNMKQLAADLKHYREAMPKHLLDVSCNLGTPTEEATVAH